MICRLIVRKKDIALLYTCVIIIQYKRINIKYFKQTWGESYESRHI